MDLPASVIAAKEKAEAIQKQLNEPAPNPDGTPAPADPAGKKDTEPQKADTQDYKARYHTLQGKYDAEIPRLQSQVRNLQEQLLSLRQENEALKTAATEKPKDPPQGTIDIDSDAMEQYGPEFKQLAESLKAVVRRNEQLEGEIRKLTGNVESVQQATAKEAHNKFLDKVRTEVNGCGGNFDQLNTDPAFLTWLHQVPPGSQFQRIAMLQDAERRHDVVQCRAIFKEYIDTLSKPATPPPPNVQPPPSPPPGDPGIQQGRKWTRKEIKAFYADKAAGKYAGKEAEAKAIEQDIFAAPGEGRVVG